jgi:NADPH2:quinone reductase
MRAVIITQPGLADVLRIEDRPVPEPSRNEIRVRVHASALNRADISQRLGRYPAPAGSPQDIPGLEYAGEVESTGADVTLWKPGERVMGIVGGGGHAEFVTVHEREAMPVPANLTWEEAGAIPEAFLTAFDAMFTRLRVRSGESLLIHAVASGVGTAAVQMAVATGVHSIGTSRSAAKLERAGALGLERGVDTSHADWVERVKAAAPERGVDAILDLVGSRFLEANLSLLANRGRIVVVGLTSGSKTEIDLGVVLRKRLHIQGTVLRSRPLEEKIAVARDFSSRMVPLFETGRLRAVIDSVRSFDEIREAHEDMESNANFGKIVLRW